MPMRHQRPLSACGSATAIEPRCSCRPAACHRTRVRRSRDLAVFRGDDVGRSRLCDRGVQRVGTVKYSLIVPVYCNEASITELIAAVTRLDRALNHALEAVFVVDGSPDRSYERLDAALPASGLTAQLIVLSRNFGSFSAVREGLAAARGDYMAMMAADLQEPEALILDFFRVLESEPIDV